MDRNTATGLILISLMLIIYFQFFSPTPPPPEEQQAPVEQPQTPQISEPGQVEEIAETAITGEYDSVANAILLQQFGEFAVAASGEAQTIELSNSDMDIHWSTKGGVLSYVHLKEFLTYHKKDLILMDENSSQFALTINGPQRAINIYDLHYKANQSTRNDTTYLQFTADLGQGKSIRQEYSLPPSGFKLGYKVEFSGLNNYLQNDLTYQWVNRMRHLEKDVETSRLKASINYYTLDDGYDGLSERSLDLEEENLGATKWVAFKQLFFTSAILNNGRFRTGLVTTEVDELDTTVVKTGKTLLTLSPTQLESGIVDLEYYFGPNNYQLLKKVAVDFDKNIYLGWPPVNVVNKFIIIPIFNFLENYIGSYGLIIIILVLVIKLILSPLSYKSYVSMAKTKVLKPELDELKAQFPDDLQKQQQEQMKLYQQVGVNPISGCVPVLLQMPILFAMFYFFPSSIELRQQSFLWAEDLSTYDSILSLPFTIPFYGSHVSLFVLLMTASTILYTWSNNQMSTVQGPMKTMTYMMPVIFMFVLNSFPAALSFYYFVSNLVTFGQQALIRRFVDEDKILEILNENRKRNKNKKKSKFQLKLEEAMKASEASKKKKK